MSKPFPSRAEPASESLPGQAGPAPLVFVLLKALFDLLSALPLGRPVVTDVRDLSAARRRQEEEVVGGNG
jgi:hypothetical protein